MRFRICPSLAFILFLLFNIDGFSQYNSDAFNRKNGTSKAMVNDILRDESGVYWIATESDGIMYSDMQYYKSFNSNNGLSTNDVLKLYSADNKVLAATFDSGLVVIEDYKIKNILKHPSIASNAVYDIALMGNQYVLACKGGGMQYLTINGLIPQKVKLQNEQVLRSFNYNGHSISGTSKHGFWVDEVKQIDSLNSYFSFAQYGSYLLGGTTKNGLKIYDTHFNNVKYFSDLEIGDNSGFMTQVVTQNKYVFLSGFKFYIASIDTINWRIDSVLTRDIKPRCLFKDYNRLLVGTERSGLSQILLQPFIEFELPNSDKIQQEIRAIYFNEDVLSVSNSTNNVFSFFNGRYLNNYKIKDFDLLDFLVDKNNTIVCTANGLEIFGSINSATLKNMIASKQFFGKEVNHIEKIGNTYYIASNGNGLYACKDNKIINYNTQNGLRDNNIYALHVGPRGDLWCGYNNSGLAVLKIEGQFSFHNQANGFPSNSIECFTNYNNGVLIGTNDSGIVYFDGKQFTRPFKSIMALNGKIKAICVVANHIWVANENGLYRLQVDANLKVLHIKNYTYFLESSGIDISSGGIQYNSHHGLYFATNKGLFKYDINLDILNSEQAAFILDEIQLVNKSVDWRKYNQDTDSTGKLPIKLNVSYDINSFTFKFHTVTLDEVRFSHRLFSSEAVEDWSGYSSEQTVSYNYLPPGDYTILIRSINSHGLLNKHLISYSFTIRPPIYKSWWFIVSSILLILGSIVFYFRWRNMQLANKNKELEVAVKMRTEELSVANTKLTHTLNDITDSINYAKRLQTAILPTKDILDSLFPKSFILFKPRDIVSGDFYWSANLSFEERKVKYAVVADCTGHGVPGAFMSMIGADKLNNIIIEKRVMDVSEIVSALNKSVKVAMRQNDHDSQTKDGMDLSVISIQELNNGKAQLNYVGSNRPLWIIKRDGSFEEIKPNKMSIGGYTETDYKFQSHTRTLEIGDRLFMFTDGFPDQFGGATSKKFMSKQLRGLLMSHRSLNIKDVGDNLNQAFIAWQGNEDQVDDVLVWGIEI
jgi:serine phosphatase RsbU (regulator of sigma subunit)